MIRAIVAILFVVVAFPARAAADADAVLARARAAYAGLTSYRDSGVVEQTVGWDMPFATAFARPDRFRFEWTSRHPFFLLYFSKTTTTIRADGSHVSYRNVLSDGGVEDRRLPTLEDAIASATGVSGGAAHHTATLLLPDLWTDRSFGASVLALEATRLHGGEASDGIRCDHVSGTTRRGRKVDIWIGQDDHLVRRVDQEYGEFKSSERHRDIRVDEPIPVSVFAATGDR